MYCLQPASELQQALGGQVGQDSPPVQTRTSPADKSQSQSIQQVSTFFVYVGPVTVCWQLALTATDLLGCVQRCLPDLLMGDWTCHRAVMFFCPHSQAAAVCQLAA